MEDTLIDMANYCLLVLILRREAAVKLDGVPQG